jgi:hypothetical protein
LRLRKLVNEFDGKNWEEIARHMNNRTAQQCRDRYNNYLIGSFLSSPWTPAEDAIVIEHYREIGPRWVEIARFLKGRSVNHIKNRWYRRLAQQVAEYPQALSNEESEESEEDTQEKETSVFLSPALQLSQGDWSYLFDLIETSFGYSHVGPVSPCP